jgi:endonuclease G
VVADVKFHEIHYDNSGTDVGEAIEVAGPAGTDLAGWSIVLYNGNGGASYGTLPLSGVIAASCGDTGVVFVAGPLTGIQNGSPDGMALVSPAGSVVEFLSYEGVFTATNGPASGMTSTDILEDEAGTEPAGRSLQRNTDGSWRGPVASTFGACNYVAPPPPPGHTFQFFGRSAFSDPPLPVGFQAQIFVTIRDGAGTVVPGAWWSSDTPLIASIDQYGVITALAAGTATFRAHTPDSVNSGTFDLPMVVATPGPAQYGHNAEFGEPADADASDDFIIRRDQYTSSYSSIRNTPNWVAYNIDATHFGSEDRCNCFTHDPLLPDSFRVITTANYTGAGAFAGYGIDRGHLARSFDRTSASLDNATTFYFTNIIPQASDNNQGPWAEMENDLGDLARLENREVYIIAGVAGSKGTVKNEGRITIPAQVWKVALILPRDAGLAQVDSWDDVQVVATVMPNDPGIRAVDWNTYRTTVDAVEGLSGYDLLALLRDDIEVAVESGTRPPVAAVDGPWGAFAGDPVAMSAAASSDADGQPLTFAWRFGDGTNGGGESTGHTYAATGSYAVRVIVTDPLGLADTVETTATITMLPPATGIARASGFVQDLLGGGALSKGEAQSLLAKLRAAAKAVEDGNTAAALGQLGAALNELDALVGSGRLTPAETGAVQEVLERTRRNLGG